MKFRRCNVGAGTQRWWSSGQYESACDEYSRLFRAKAEENSRMYFAPGMRIRIAALLASEEVEKMFPHPRASEGFELLCLKHGIYGRRDRGDNCGPCARVGDVFIPEAKWYGQRWVDTNLVPPLEYVIDKRLGPGEFYILQNRVEVHPNKEANVATVKGQKTLDEQFSEAQRSVMSDDVDAETAKGIAKILNQPGQVFQVRIPPTSVSIDTENVQDGDAVTIGGIRFVAQRGGDTDRRADSGRSEPGPIHKAELHEPPPRRMGTGCREEIGPYAAAQVFDGHFFHDECSVDAGMPVRDTPRFFARQHPTMNAVELIDSTCETMPILIAYELLASAMVGFRTTGGEQPTERIGDQVRHCFVCGKKQTVDHFNLSVSGHKHVGKFGDAEDLYICDADVGDVLKAVRRVKESRARQPAEHDQADLLADDE